MTRFGAPKRMFKRNEYRCGGAEVKRSTDRDWHGRDAPVPGRVGTGRRQGGTEGRDRQLVAAAAT
ncbi:MAG: hypothetical protein R8L07_09125 [Alphaproteobacteria bacterium]|nr:hypothetical protein [Alphaproteobacteria bacterium]